MVTEADCIFCKIVRGEIPSKKVYEDKDTLAFLDINPANPGHTLVVPKKHSEDITKSDEEDIAKVMRVVKNITTNLKEKMNAIGVNVMQNNGKPAGQIVAHTHFHVIPRYPNDVVVISYQRVQLSDEQLEEIRKKLSEEKKRSFDFDF
ncbi:MAG: Hit-like protein involved in cell-cycle regulation [archaeon GW2011_AR5]|nr:MAG: Hit-like protein involved in cell-cycle regulation [archaeon GW2011_AR5]